MNRRLFALFALLGVSVAHTQTAQLVYPNQLNHAKSMELGQLVLLLMPDAGSASVGWDHRASSDIVWTTNGYDSEQWGKESAYVRRGVVRVNVEGKRSTVLRQQVNELGWSVALSSTSNPSFGPEDISITVGTPDTDCFGAKYDGCNFDPPLKSLALAGIEAKKICAKTRFSDQVIAFTIVHPKRRPTLLIWEESGGSGGISSSLTMKLNDKPDASLCDSLLSE
jgi:hypothetical protein